MKTIIVENFEQLWRAIEIEEADEIVVKGQINCQNYRAILKKGCKLVGLDGQSGLIFEYGEAQSAIWLEGGCVENLKIQVLAETYPDKDRMQSVIEVNRYGSRLKDVFLDIKVKDARIYHESLQYSGLYVRHELVLAGNIRIRSKGHYVAPIANCQLATSRLVGNNVFLLLELFLVFFLTNLVGISPSRWEPFHCISIKLFPTMSAFDYSRHHISLYILR